MKPLKKEEVTKPGWYWMFGADGKEKNNIPNGVWFVGYLNTNENGKVLCLDFLESYSFMELSNIVETARFYGPLESPE